MRKAKFIALAALSLLALAGVAKASGVIGSTDHKDPAYDVLEDRVELYEQALKREAASDGGAGTSSVRRGPRGKRGPKGARGVQGPAGPIGAKGTFGSVVSIDGPPISLCGFFSGSCAVGRTQADCPPGTTLTGGGYKGAGIVTTVTWSAPVGNSWAIIAANLDEVSVNGLRAVAECASPAT